MKCPGRVRDKKGREIAMRGIKLNRNGLSGREGTQRAPSPGRGTKGRKPSLQDRTSEEKESNGPEQLREDASVHKFSQVLKVTGTACGTKEEAPSSSPGPPRGPSCSSWPDSTLSSPGPSSPVVSLSVLSLTASVLVPGKETVEKAEGGWLPFIPLQSQEGQHPSGLQSQESGRVQGV